MTAKSFNVGGGWGSTYGWNANVDDEAALDADGKKTVNNIVQYQWDVTGQYAQGTGTDNHLIVYVPGTTVNNGIWFYRTTDVDATAMNAVPHGHTRYSNQTINWNISGVQTGFQTASAFVNGVIPTVTTGPTVTQTRTAHSGIIPSAVDFTIRNPSPGDFYTKTGAGKFKIKFLDQNEPATYILRVTWTTLTGTIEDTQVITQGSGDIELEYTGTSPSNTPVYGPITLQIDQAIYNNGQQYIANTIFKTFTYHETGPFTASFSPDFGLPGQSVNVIVTDTNPFPDETSHFWYRGFDGTVHANDHNFHIDASGTTTGTTTFTSTHGNYNLYKGTRYDTSSLLATANYDTNYVATTTSNGGGKPDRYPLIMTNLFNRNRSIYSIGMTHKDTWDLFL